MRTQLPGPGASGSGSHPPVGSDTGRLRPPPALSPASAQPGGAASGFQVPSALHPRPTETRSLGAAGSLGSYPCPESALRCFHEQVTHRAQDLG